MTVIHGIKSLMIQQAVLISESRSSDCETDDHLVFHHDEIYDCYIACVLRSYCV